MAARENSEKYLEASRLIGQAVQLLVSKTDSPDELHSAYTQPESTERERAPQQTTNSGTLPGLMSQGTEVWRSASQKLHDAFAPYSRQAYQFNRLEIGRGRRASTSSGSRHRRSSHLQTNNTRTHKFCVIPYKDLQ